MLDYVGVVGSSVQVASAELSWAAPHLVLFTQQQKAWAAGLKRGERAGM